MIDWLAMIVAIVARTTSGKSRKGGHSRVEDVVRGWRARQDQGGFHLGRLPADQLSWLAGGDGRPLPSLSTAPGTPVLDWRERLGCGSGLVDIVVSGTLSGHLCPIGLDLMSAITTPND
jgi:hypothetical protein